MTMNYSYNEIFGAFSVVLSFIGYVPYFRDVFRGNTRPHIFSWFLWGLLDAIAVTAQIIGNAGPGAWALIFGMIACFSVTAVAFRRGKKYITKSDWFTFAAAIAAILVWMLTKEPLGAVVLVVLIDVLAFYPTFRKSYFKPYEETALTWSINSLKFVFALLALEQVSLITALYPSYLVVANGALVVMLFWRRRVVAVLS